MRAKSLQLCLTLPPYRLYPPRLLCPWDSPGKNTGVGCHALLQGICPTQESNPCLLHLLHWPADFTTVPSGEATAITTCSQTHSYLIDLSLDTP